jgi:Tfp pilus assembly protein PilX
MSLYARGNGQRGSALLPAVVILVLVTFMGVFTMQTAGNQKQMVQGLENRNASFSAAMTALRDAENNMDGRTQEPDPQDKNNCTSSSQPCVLKSDELDLTTDVKKWGNSKVVGEKAFDQSSQVGHYYIELNTYRKDTLVQGQKRDTRKRTMYNVRAHGVGAADRGDVVVESVFAKRYR